MRARGVEVEGASVTPGAARGLGGQQAGGRGLDRARAGQAARPSPSWSTPSRRLYPVGRLDADSTGLILLTNDGELANRLTHPRYGVPKTYRVASPGRPPSAISIGCAAGCGWRTGPTAPAEVEQTRGARARDHDPRGPQAPGAPDGRGDRERGRGARPGSGSGRSTSASSAAGRRGGSRRERSPRSGKIPRHERRPHDSGRCVARPRPQQRPRDDRRCDRGADAGADRRNELDARADGELHLHLDPRPERRVPGRRGTQPRPRRGPAALRAGDRRPGRDALRDPRSRPLLRAARITPRRTPISARPRICART